MVNLQVLALDQWKRRIMCLKEEFVYIAFSHIYKVHNSVVDKLSKKVVGLPYEILYYQICQNGVLSSTVVIPFD
jgi:hypothetical protein